MKVYLRTFGCRANQYDTGVVRGMLEAAGHEIAASAAGADVAVFNSCAVTASAEADLRKAVRRAARERPALRSVIMGCASGRPDSRAIKELRALPSVAATLAGADYDGLARTLGLDSRSAAAARQTSSRALLRIQDGCDEHCTFCVTTIARGVNRSRAMAELVAEARALAAQHREIVLTGVHIGTYGRDIGSSLAELLQRLAQQVPGARFRLSSVEATEVHEPIVELMAGAPERVAPHLHAPLQSGSGRLLKRMGRHWYTAESYAAAVERLASRVPHLGLGADVIAGFPGETQEDHAATMALVERLPFTYLHVFPFSLRPGTAAGRLPDPVAPATAERRARELREIGDAKAAAYRAARAGSRADVVVVRGGATGEREGMTEDYLTVGLDAPQPRGARFVARLRSHERTGRLIAEEPQGERG